MLIILHNFFALQMISSVSHPLPLHSCFFFEIFEKVFSIIRVEIPTFPPRGRFPQAGVGVEHSNPRRAPERGAGIDESELGRTRALAPVLKKWEQKSGEEDEHEP